MKPSFVAAVLSLISVLVVTPAHARDWFVRAGATGGDGSRAKPFGDPWEALERVEAGDKVHVAEGRYFGKLDAGNWVIPFPGVQLLGGYDAAWKERDPWRRVTELAWRRESPTRPNVSLARVSDGGGRDTPGAVVDGFLIDMQSTYVYGPNGMAPVSLNMPGAVDLRGRWRRHLPEPFGLCHARRQLRQCHHDDADFRLPVGPLI